MQYMPAGTRMHKYHKNILNGVQYSESPIEHKCEKPGCTETIILDGNMKNHRAVCAVTHAGYIVYKDIPGQVRSGCQNSPAFDSFCTLHKPVLAMPQHPACPITICILRRWRAYFKFSQSRRRAGWYHNQQEENKEFDVL